jgi:hypothetical protein
VRAAALHGRRVHHPRFPMVPAAAPPLNLGFVATTTMHALPRAINPTS